jgi:hypothetical protein
MEIIGKCFAGNNRLADGTTLADKYPKKYDNVLADYVNLVIAETKARMSVEQASGLKNSSPGSDYD